MFKDVKETMLFPYSKEMLNLVKFRDLLEFNIKSIVSFKSWGYIGRDASCIDGSQLTGYIVSDCFEGELDKVDTVVLGSFSKYYGDEGILEKYIESVLKSEKNIILLDNSKPIDLEKYKRKFKEINKNFYYFNPQSIEESLINQISVPVIGVFGLEEDCGKTEMLLLIGRALRKKGYKVSILGANPQINLLGGHSYPKVLYDDNTGDISKIKSIRSYANKILETEKPSILIISSPYGISSIIDKEIEYRYNGILSHIIIEALHPDGNIFCIDGGRDLMWSKRSKEVLELLSRAPTLITSMKRINKRPETSFYDLNAKLKKGLFNDKIFTELKKTCEEFINIRVFDQDYLNDDEIVDLVETTFDVKNRFINII